MYVYIPPRIHAQRSFAEGRPCRGRVAVGNGNTAPPHASMPWPSMHVADTAYQGTDKAVKAEALEAEALNQNHLATEFDQMKDVLQKAVHHLAIVKKEHSPRVSQVRHQVTVLANRDLKRKTI